MVFWKRRKQQNVQKTLVSGADFSGAILEGTDFRGVDLSAVQGLTEKQLEQAVTDEQTQLPDLSPPTPALSVRPQRLQ